MKIQADHHHRISVGLVILAVLLVLSASTSADAQKSLYVNADLNSNSPIEAYSIQPAPTFLTYQAVSNTTGYGGVGLAIDTDSAMLFVTYEFEDYLKIVNATTLNVPEASVTAPGASNLAGIVVDQELALVYTVDRWTDNLYVYNWDASTFTLSLAGQYDLSGIAGVYHNGAIGLALDEVNDILYVSAGTTTVYFYHTSDFTTLAGTVTLQNDAIGIAVDVPNGFLYTGSSWFSYSAEDHFSKYDLATSTETVIYLGNGIGVMGIAVDTDTGLVYVTTGYYEDAIRVYDSGLTLLHNIGGIGNPTGIVVPGKPISYNPLNLTKDDGLAEDGCLYAGDFITYDLCYDNITNTYPVENVTLVDTLSFEMHFVSATDGGTYRTATHDVFWDLGDLAAGAPQQCVQLVVEIDGWTAPETVITNYAAIDSDATGPSFPSEVTEVCANQPPVALCTDPVIEAGEGCVADGSVDDGSYDPDGDDTTITEVPPPPHSLGDTLVTLTIEDSHGATDTCTGMVSVVDTTPPEAFCNSPPTIIPPDAPIAFTSTTSDYCGSTVVITGYDCWAINGAGKLISKLESCVVSFAGDTITIDDSGGVGDHIDWFVEATDSSGNTTQMTCSVEVIRP